MSPAVARPTGWLRHLASAAAGQGDGIQLWRRQLDLAHELDDELGAAGAGELVDALVERLAETLVHTVPRSARAELAALLVDAATLAGTQALDRTHHDRAWRRFDQARTAALVAERPAAGAARWPVRPRYWWTSANRTTAVELLEQTPPMPEGPAQARLRRGAGRGRGGQGRVAGEPPCHRRGRAEAAPLTPDLLDPWTGRPSSWSTCIAGRAGCW